MADTASYDAVFTEVVEPRINSILDESSIALRLAQRRQRKFNGKQFEIPLNIGHNQGIGARSEFGDLPAAGQEEYKRAIYTPADNWAQMKFSQRLIEMAKSDKGALKDAISSETDGLLKSVKQELNRQIFGDGTGLLANTGVTAASTTVVCTNTKHIKVNMRVDILTRATGAVKAADRKVTQVTPNASFVIDGAAVTTDANDGVYRAGNRVGATNYEFAGLQAMVAATGTFGGLSPATAGLEQWYSTVNAAVGLLTDENMQATWDAPAERGVDASTDRILIGTYGTRRTFGKLLQSQRRFNVGTRKAEHPKLAGGGFDSLEYNGTDFLVDRMCPAQTNYYIDNEAWEYLVLARGFKTEDGSKLKDDGGTGYKAPYFVMSCLGSDNRGAHSAQTGVTES